MSVPNQYSSDGGRVRFAGASAVGSTVARNGAKIAISTINADHRPAKHDGGVAMDEAHDPAALFRLGQHVGQA